jgi:hypothetical protein
MFADYQKLVVEYYHQQKGDRLSANLTFLTPANLKEECKKVCAQRFTMKDEQVIRDFFGKGGTQKDCLQAIKDCGIDKFRPLIKFLNAETAKTDEKNIFLLAWLLDFPDRPFVLSKHYGSGASVDSKVTVIEPIDDHPVDQAVGRHDLMPIEEGYIGVENTHKQISDDSLEKGQGTGTILKEEGAFGRVISRWLYWKAVGIVGWLLVVGVAGYFWWYNTQMLMTTGNGACMYWADDHYEPIPCSQKVPNKLVRALDTGKVRSFKKITQPDTITNRAKGFVWYSKIDKKIEFFTADGDHPEVLGRSLKPITDYIIDKYIHPGMTSNQ